MLRILSFFLIGFIIFSCGCKQEEKLNNCANVKCESPSIILRLRFEDSRTGNDLLFGLNKKYGLNDISIYSSRLKKEVEFKIDGSNVKNSSILFVSNSSDEFTISLAKIKVDVLKVETKYTKSDCCGTLELAGFASTNANSAIAYNNSNIIIIKI
ncbi:hypothetical protein A5893_05995 [Pedobacter psychrophilus]|uniref:Uncharacterized protein n=1 Tax=Pedobacter psychrophilus TaxID=1826909 RepID=A0A179DHE6_9SPHI|nr:hypothetical protein [Pedobacter psychrophilus]OAQ40497.1 hypothetical protein A5893_05995 [Pedobacter psychrophilus]